MDNKVFEKFSNLETKRLKLRQLRLNDAPQIFEFNSNIETLKYVPRTPFTKIEQTIEKTDFFINSFSKKEAIWWAFVQKKSENFDKLIGYGGLIDIDKDSNKAEIGYGLLQPFWGKGLMCEAVKSICNFGIGQMHLNKKYFIWIYQI